MHVLVDGSNSLNIIPNMSAKALCIKVEENQSDYFIIYDFNNHSQVIKVMVLHNLFIDCIAHSTRLYMINVPPSSIMFLSHPWIHSAIAVSSTLH